jgi:hypothetical protein
MPAAIVAAKGLLVAKGLVGMHPVTWVLLEIDKR